MKFKTKTAAFIACLSIFAMLLSCPLAMGRTAKKKARVKKKTCVTAAPKKTVKLKDEDEKLTINLGDELLYCHSVHASVGYGYWIDYDEDAFKMDCETVYLYPENMEQNMCGGDAAERTCVLQSLKKGDFTVKVIHDFRGETEQVITYTVIVK